MIDSSSALEWLRHHGLQGSSIQPLAGDVSPRKYFRVVPPGGASQILAGYPPSHADSYGLFVQTTELMRNAGARVPEILGLDEKLRWMLLEDVGDKTLYSHEGSWADLESLFLAAIETQRCVRQIPVSKVTSLNPHLDTPALRRELDQTFERVLVPCGLVADVGLRRHLETTLELICRQIGSADLVPCHRDFMARNLVPRAESEMGLEGLVVLDHQDLRMGPSHYDLASLLNDSLFPPIELEERLVGAALDSEREMDSYRRSAVQRTLKAAGTFGAFAHRGFPRYLPLIPPTLSRSLDQLARLPEGRELATDLRHHWKKALDGTLLDCL